MIKQIIHTSLIALGFAISTWAMELEQVAIGEEYIQPLRYPKFAAAFEYGMMRKYHGLEDSRLRADLPNNFGVSLITEAAPYKYLNAGGLFSLNLPRSFEHEFQPIHMRLALFAKPYIPLGDRISIFGRFGGGLTVSMLNYLRWSPLMDRENFPKLISEIYGIQEYSNFPWGANLMTTIGLEAFLLERVGLAVEWGFRADYIYASKGSMLERFINQQGQKPTGREPNARTYFIYEMPLMFNLEIIL